MRDRRGSCSDSSHGRLITGLRSCHRRCGKRCRIWCGWRHLVRCSSFLRWLGGAWWWKLGIGRAGHGRRNRSGNSDGRSRWRRCCWRRGAHGFSGANQARYVQHLFCPIAATRCSGNWNYFRTQRLFQHPARFGRGQTHRPTNALRDTQELVPSVISQPLPWTIRQPRHRSHRQLQSR